MEKQRAVRTGDKASPLILTRRFWQPVSCDSRLFLFYLVDEPLLIKDRVISNKQSSSNSRFEQQPQSPFQEENARSLNKLWDKRFIFYPLKRRIAWKRFYCSYYYCGYTMVSPDEFLKMAGVMRPPETNEIRISAPTSVFS